MLRLYCLVERRLPPLPPRMERVERPAASSVILHNQAQQIIVINSINGAICLVIQYACTRIICMQLYLVALRLRLFACDVEVASATGDVVAAPSLVMASHSQRVSLATLHQSCLA